MLRKYKEELQDNNKIYLKIKVRPEANETGVKEIMTDGTIKIDIAALPIKDKANQELIKFLAKEFKVNKNDIKIISGAKSGLKLVKITK